MPLTRVTITGADDAVDPTSLALLSREFPFVEWGVLRSATREGTPRYPSEMWRRRLEKEAGGTEMALAAHLCGRLTRDTLGGDQHWVQTVGAEYDRVQLNGFRVGAAVAAHVGRYGVEWILQAPDEPLVDEAAALAASLPRNDACRVSILWDPSGGRGVRGDTWPYPPYGIPIGFAGGITPDNVSRVLSELAARRHQYWIDMESGVRDLSDAFDLAKVRDVLEQAREFVADG